MKFEVKQEKFVPPPVEYVLTLSEQEAKWLEREINVITNDEIEPADRADFFWQLYSNLPYGGDNK